MEAEIVVDRRLLREGSSVSRRSAKTSRLPETRAVALLVLPFLLSPLFCEALVSDSATESTTAKLSHPFHKDFRVTWGNVTVSDDGRAELSLDKASGSGWSSNQPYYNGWFSAWIKVPSGYTPGVVTAFYLHSEWNTSWPGDFHDEVDMEFLGERFSSDVILQTNWYGQGVGGHEERLKLCSWATQYGALKIDWAHAPFRAGFHGLHVDGCYWRQMDEKDAPACALTRGNRDWQPTWEKGMEEKDYVLLRHTQAHYMTYSYALDKTRKPFKPKRTAEVTVVVATAGEGAGQTEQTTTAVAGEKGQQAGVKGGVKEGKLRGRRGPGKRLSAQGR
ncbi:unnamed protein product [Closterium sp. NIES-64]|nr:unnamed protein product [Closterium sp. NIES-64]